MTEVVTKFLSVFICPFVYWLLWNRNSKTWGCYNVGLFWLTVPCNLLLQMEVLFSSETFCVATGLNGVVIYVFVSLPCILDGTTVHWRKLLRQRTEWCKRCKKKRCWKNWLYMRLWFIDICSVVTELHRSVIDVYL